MKLGCHAVLFKERIKSETDFVLQGLANTGFEGTEIGSRFFGTNEKKELESKLQKHGIELSGMHVGGPLEDWITKEEEMASSVLKVRDFVQDMPNKNILLSGRTKEKELDLKLVAQKIEKVAKQCLDKGVKLNYHNHSLEFENDAKIFKTLVEYVPSLYFGLDLGWVYAGGFDPIEIVKKYANRVSYVHLRDVKENIRDLEEKKEGFVPLGEGIINYSKLMNVLQDVLGENGWVVVEYEGGEQDFERYKKAKDFLDSLK